MSFSKTTESPDEAPLWTPPRSQEGWVLWTCSKHKWKTGPIPWLKGTGNHSLVHWENLNVDTAFFLLRATPDWYKLDPLSRSLICAKGEANHISVSPYERGHFLCPNSKPWNPGIGPPAPPVGSGPTEEWTDVHFLTGHSLWSSLPRPGSRVSP